MSDSNSSENPILFRNQNYIPQLDGLKGLAILSVLLFHVGISQTVGAFANPNLPHALFPLGRGVNLFFIVSAFAIFHNFSATPKSEWSTSAFFIRRAFRILPLWWLTCLIVFVNWAPYLERLGLTASMLFGFSERRNEINIVPAGWSLFVEESFYLLFPIWCIAARRLWGSLICLGLAWWASDLYLNWLGADQSDLSKSASEHPLMSYHCFFLGISIYHIYRSPLAMRFLVKLTPFFLLDFIAIYGLVRSLRSYNREASLYLCALVIAALVRGTLFHRLCGNAILRWFGVYCYGIYLLHGPIQLWTVPQARWLTQYVPNGEFQTILLFAALLSISAAASYISFRFLEGPCIRLGKRISRNVIARAPETLSK